MWCASILEGIGRKVHDGVRVGGGGYSFQVVVFLSWNVVILGCVYMDPCYGPN